MINNTVGVVTGATGGLGLETARGLAKAGLRVVLVGRNAEKGERALSSIRGSVPDADVTFLRADLSDMDDVRALAGAINNRFDRLDVLVNNAGAIMAKRQLTKAGLEVTFATNHLSHFLLTGLLLDLIKASAPARIINVSSDAHKIAKLDPEDLQSEKRYTSFGTYGVTKLENLYFTYELARRLEGSNVTVNALHPGAVASNFAMNNGGISSLAMNVLRPLFMKPEKAAETPIWLSTSPEVEGVTGKYFYKMREHKPSRQAFDDAKGRALWDKSDQLTGYPYAATLLPASLSRPVDSAAQP